VRRVYLLLSLFLILQGICEASEQSRWDVRYESFARSNPIGAYARAEAGYSIPLWGEFNPKKPLYGFVRPMARFQTSGLINNAMFGVEFNPISFFSFYTAKSFMRRDLKKLDNYDCDTNITCRSNNIQRDIWGLKFALKVGGVFFMNRLQWHTTNIKDRQAAGFAEEQGTLIGSGSKDVLFQSIQVLGYDLNETQGFGLLHKRNIMRNSRQSSTMVVALYKHVYWDRSGLDWNILAGPGTFYTRQKTHHPLLFALVQYRPKKGWTIF
jgi:hypothetical protein